MREFAVATIPSEKVETTLKSEVCMRKETSLEPEISQANSQFSKKNPLKRPTNASVAKVSHGTNPGFTRSRRICLKRKSYIIDAKINRLRNAIVGWELKLKHRLI
jgi:hypothetical protein